MVVIVGIVGTRANWIVLYVLCVLKQVKKHAMNILFVNQMSLDLFGSFWVFVIYAVKLAYINLEGTAGYWLCIFIVSEDLQWFGLCGSKLNLMSIAIERYVKSSIPPGARTVSGSG
jgi:hypothetical protein